MDISPLTVRGRHFYDAQGRQVLLHGINLVNKYQSAGYLGNEDEAFFARLRGWGFNCLRLGVIWDGLEPQPGQYNAAYLQGIDRQITLARQQGLYVFLDMHQDLYSVLFSDGAPAWATLTDGAPHDAQDGIWSDAYFTSPAVQAALDNFWKNTPGPDGVGIQERYALAWGVLARRYVNEPAVIGYDLMNEPFPGSSARQAQALMFAKGTELLAAAGFAAGTQASEADAVKSLAQMWLTPEGRFAILQILGDIDIYTQVVDAAQPLYAEFERSHLMELYRRAAEVIRGIDPHKMLFLETSMASNMGGFSGIQPLAGSDGAPDLLQVYAAHGYDLVTDTPYVAQANPQRVALIFRRHHQTAQRLGMPMLVGEWGAYGNAPGTLPAAWQVTGVFEDLQCSDTFWAYYPGAELADCFPAIQRPYPQRVAGTLQDYHYDPVKTRFTCTWQEDPAQNAPTSLYLPDWLPFDPEQIKLSPAGLGFQVRRAAPTEDSLMLEIYPLGQQTVRQLRIDF
jgi:endoglycosylceramidase